KPGDGDGVAMLAAGIGVRAGVIAGGEALDTRAESLMSGLVRAEEVDRVEINCECATGKTDRGLAGQPFRCQRGRPGRAELRAGVVELRHPRSLPAPGHQRRAVVAMRDLQ